MEALMTELIEVHANNLLILKVLVALSEETRNAQKLYI